MVDPLRLLLLLKETYIQKKFQQIRKHHLVMKKTCLSWQSQEDPAGESLVVRQQGCLVFCGETYYEGGGSHRRHRYKQHHYHHRHQHVHSNWSSSTVDKLLVDCRFDKFLPIYYCNLFNRWKYNPMGIMYVPSLFMISAQMFNTNLISGVLPSFWSTASSIRSALKELLRKQ